MGVWVCVWVWVRESERGRDRQSDRELFVSLCMCNSLVCTPKHILALTPHTLAWLAHARARAMKTKNKPLKHTADKHNTRLRIRIDYFCIFGSGTVRH